ncbi:MAG: aminomethyl-transferring glycine dehydrogenase subunit GcvPA [Actinomycetota bacterium]|nr:aminomethyl-transferring glycine dehydrogenase subunit GcvPA [Actinomycetota bacterium]
MAGYIPHTDAEVETMLAFLGLASLDELFSVVPDALRLAASPGRGHDQGGEWRFLDLADGLGEPDVLAEVERLASANLACTGPGIPADGGLVCFAGGGAYDHEVPEAVRALASRSEYVTAYTPYQPEVAQGVLQALFEYQTMVARLAGLAVANASLYDGASACVEAVNLTMALTGRSGIWLSRGVHPHWRATMATFAVGSGAQLVDVPLHDGLTAWPSAPPSGPPPAALVLAYPNYLGCLEDLDAARRAADAVGALLVVTLDPVAAGLLRPPGQRGADVVVGEGQPLGTPLSFGGPYLGLFACRADHVRRLPGRLVGETVDTEGRRAYVATLRTREQDIRRERASSNVCTNQTLIAVACAVQMAWLGTSGLRELALRCARATRYTRESLLALDGVEPLAGAPTLREFAVRLPTDPAVVVDRMIEEGYLAGIALGAGLGADSGDDAGGSEAGSDAGYGTGLLVAATERRTRGQIDAYVAAMDKAIR